MYSVYAVFILFNNRIETSVFIKRFCKYINDWGLIF